MTAEQKRIQIMQNLKVGDHIILDDTGNQRSIPVSAIIFAIYDKLEKKLGVVAEIILQKQKLSKKAYSTEGVSWFSSEFEKDTKQLTSVHENTPWLNVMRQAALDRFLVRGFPTTNHEHWRYTNLSSWLNLPLSITPSRPVWEYLHTQLIREALGRGREA